MPVRTKAAAITANIDSGPWLRSMGTSSKGATAAPSRLRAHAPASREPLVHIRSLTTLRLVAALAIVSAATPAASQDYYKGKSITLFAGQPPGGGIDSEMRLVAHYFGRFIPGEPVVIARNMPGAGGMVLGNHLYNVARPDGLMLGMPGRSGFVLAPVIGAGDVKYDLRKFTWIGSSASTNYILWLRRGANIGT